MIVRPSMMGMLADLAKNGVFITQGSGAPTDGTSGTGVLVAGKGSVYIDRTNQRFYINVGTVTSPTWISIDEETVSTGDKTVATTGNTDFFVIAPRAGRLTSLIFSGLDALAAHDSNYITFTATNLGAAGAGTAAMLAATDPNTTKATGGTALAASTPCSLTLTSTAADLVVARGDRIRIRAAATGTLANTVTFALVQARFGL